MYLAPIHILSLQRPHTPGTITAVHYNHKKQHDTPSTSRWVSKHQAPHLCYSAIRGGKKTRRKTQNYRVSASCGVEKKGRKGRKGQSTNCTCIQVLHYHMSRIDRSIERVVCVGAYCTRERWGDGGGSEIGTSPDLRELQDRRRCIDGVRACCWKGHITHMYSSRSLPYKAVRWNRSGRYHRSGRWHQGAKKKARTA